MLVATGVGRDTVVDGFTISSGHADDLDAFLMTTDFAEISGGGFLGSDTAAPTLSNNWFTYNYALSEGGAVNGRGAVLVEDSYFAFNHAHTGNGGAIGLGVHIGAVVPGALIRRSKFMRNYAVSEGGAVNVFSGADATIEQCYFEDNYSLATGGAVSIVTGATAVVRDSFFYDNKARFYGGALYVSASGNLTLENVTVVGNDANADGGVTADAYGHGLAVEGIPAFAETVSVKNSIFWDNGDQNNDDAIAHRLPGPNSMVEVRWSTVQGLSAASPIIGPITTSNLNDSDPLFRSYPAEPVDLHILRASAVVDAGDPNGLYAGRLDIDQENRVELAACPQVSFSGAPIDIGADEVSYPMCWLGGTQCYGDANVDGAVNAIDIGIVSLAMNSEFGDPEYDECADINRDGYVNLQDESIVSDNGFTAPPADCSCDDEWPPPPLP